MAAPVLNNSASFTLNPIDEGAPPSASGTTVAALIVDGTITDPDNTAPPEAIAISQVDTANGSWEYSGDGGSSWSAVDSGLLASGQLLVLDAGARLRFVPAYNFFGSATFSFFAWDGTGSLSGSYASLDADQLSVDSAVTQIVVNDTLDTYTGNAQDNVLTGDGGSDNLIGRAGNDTLYGFGGNDTLNGGLDGDQMYGGAGDDTYIVGEGDDVVIEFLNEGVDLVRSSIDWVLSANVENLTLTGSAIRGTGNELANLIIGTAGANILDGGEGADTLRGGAGDDIYFVDHEGDLVQESVGGGWDTVYSSVSFGRTNIEAIYLTGIDNIDATGNALDNVLVGNDGDNRLEGRAGRDYMEGGAGDDLYIMDGDDFLPVDSGGFDTVETSGSIDFSANYTSPAGHEFSIEVIRLTGTSSSSAAGWYGDETIFGNSGNNVLKGNHGNNTLIGGGGSDTFVLSRAYGGGVDLIVDFRHNTDKIGLGLSFDLHAYFDPNTGAMTNTGFFWQGSAAHDADDRIIYDRASGSLIWDSDGTGANPAVVIAVLGTGTTHPNLTATDFVQVWELLL